MIRFNLVDLPTRISLSYFWCVGFVLSAFMIIQVASGVVLSLFYDAFGKFPLLMMWSDDSIFCWFIRYLHIWGVSIIFLLVYIHIGRGLYYKSYSKIGVWKVGFVIYILLMIEAFLGYILPWHQMSYWAATVLTSILLRIPIIGANVYSYVIGGYSVTMTDTLVRVFPVHISLGFILLGLIFLHLFYLHSRGSSVPLFFFKRYRDCVYFHRYHSIKDLFLFIVLFTILGWVMLVNPNLVLDLDAFIMADPMVTPVKIKPEWYFLSFYAMLRSIESKIGGLIFILCILFVIWLPRSNIRSIYLLDRQVCFWFMVGFFLVLRYLGGCHAEHPYVVVSKICSLFFLLLLFVYKVFWIIPHRLDLRLFQS